MALNAYITATQSLVNDPSAQRFSIPTLTTYINTARSQLALEGECVRFNFGLDGIFYPTANYSGSTVSVGNPSLQPPLLDNIAGWIVNSVALSPGTSVLTSTVNAGGFLNTITLSAPVATTGGPFSFTLSPPNITNTGQEMYASPPTVCLTTGVQGVVGIRGVNINYGGVGANMYAMRYKDWSFFQGYFRSYPNLTGNPVYWTRYQNVQNSVFLRPIPAAQYPMQWDCQCTVVPLVNDSTPEAIPYAFSDAIPYFAANLAFLQTQRKDDAKAMYDQYLNYTRLARKYFQSTYVPDIYEQQ